MITARHEYMDRPILASDLNFEGDKGVTKQADLKESDINYIMKRFEKTGTLPEMILKNGHYGDYTAVPDYQEAMNIINLAQSQFEALDVNVRNRFENNPEKFLAFTTNPENYDEMEKMGLLKPELVEARRAERHKASADRLAAEKVANDLAEKALIAKIKAELAK
jgi:Chlamydia-phage Chp2 scaffold (Chlamy_scaf).